MHHFHREGINDADLINEFCELYYGPSWKVLIGFGAYCMPNRDKIPVWIESFLEKKNIYV